VKKQQKNHINLLFLQDFSIAPQHTFYKTHAKQTLTAAQ